MDSRDLFGDLGVSKRSQYEELFFVCFWCPRLVQHGTVCWSSSRSHGHRGCERCIRNSAHGRMLICSEDFWMAHEAPPTPTGTKVITRVQIAQLLKNFRGKGLGSVSVASAFGKETDFKMSKVPKTSLFIACVGYTSLCKCFWHWGFPQTAILSNSPALGFLSPFHGVDRLRSDPAAIILVMLLLDAVIRI